MGNTTEPIKIIDNNIIDDDEIPTENEVIDNPLNIKFDKYQRQQELHDYLRDQNINNLKKNRILEELNSYLDEKIDIEHIQNEFTLEIQNLKEKSNLNENNEQLIEIISNKNKYIIEILQKKKELINILEKLNKLIEEIQLNFKKAKLKDENRFKMLDKDRNEHIENMNQTRTKFLNKIINLKKEKNVVLNEIENIKNENNIKKKL